MPPHRVAGVDGADWDLCLEDCPVPLFGDLQRVDSGGFGDSTELMVRNVLFERAEKDVRHRVSHHRHNLECAVPGALGGERQPPLERPKKRRVPGSERALPDGPRVVLVKIAFHNVPVDLLVGGVMPAADAAVVHVFFHPRLYAVPGEAVAPAIDVGRLYLRKDPLFPALFVDRRPDAVQPFAGLGEGLVLARVLLCLRVVHLLHASVRLGLAIKIVVDRRVRLRLRWIHPEGGGEVRHDVCVHPRRLLGVDGPANFDDPSDFQALDNRFVDRVVQDVLYVDRGDPPLRVSLDLLNPRLDAFFKPFPDLLHLLRIVFLYLVRRERVFELCPCHLLLAHLPHALPASGGERRGPQVHIPRLPPLPCDLLGGLPTMLLRSPCVRALPGGRFPAGLELIRFLWAVIV
mmetsp:Transcript_51060/g.120972  ORF Transcript_51060/g.120972 Transcript_51060/m.120972 type:complete len:404 (-) Transcript_51060:441-1652(-)